MSVFQEFFRAFRQFIADKTLEYARRDSNDEIVIEYSPLTMESYTKTLEGMFKCLIQVSRPRGPKNAKVLHFEPYEMMWKDKHEKYTTFAEQAEYLSEFLDKMLQKFSGNQHPSTSQLLFHP